MAQRNGPSRGTKAVAEVAGGVISRCRVAWSARLDKSSNLSTPLKKCIGSPEQKYISDAGKKAPDWGPFRQASGLGGIIRRRGRGGPGGGGLGLIEPGAVAVHFQHMDVVGEAVEECARARLGTQRR